MAFNKVLLSFFALFALASLGFCEEGPVCIADGDCQVNDDTSFICNRQTGTCEKAFRPSLDNTPGCNVNEESSCPLGYTCQNNQCVRNHGIACVAGQCLDSTMTCNKLTNMCAPAAPGQNRGIACVNGNFQFNDL
ncbi:hypothetical protein L596_022615 [Steinernema carpocapsae]|uniref:EB domain-containing protein n=1 Tax=Steinernema carpocapsae TaxID=34508 RepID=A0A4U5MMM3_STECR|nr:hypothetical protein L596_022615 [Steinernema carpocapsae]